jgi:hypothetical protein
MDKSNKEHVDKVASANDVLKTAAAAASRLRELKAKLAATAEANSGKAADSKQSETSAEAKRDQAKREADPVHDLRERHAKACARVTRNPLFRPATSAAAALTPQQCAHALRFIADYLQVCFQSEHRRR